MATPAELLHFTQRQRQRTGGGGGGGGGGGSEPEPLHSRILPRPGSRGTLSASEVVMDALTSRDLYFATAAVGLYGQMFRLDSRHTVGMTVAVWMAHMLRRWLNF